MARKKEERVMEIFGTLLAIWVMLLGIATMGRQGQPFTRWSWNKLVHFAEWIWSLVVQLAEWIWDNVTYPIKVFWGHYCYHVLCFLVGLILGVEYSSAILELLKH